MQGIFGQAVHLYRWLSHGIALPGHVCSTRLVVVESVTLTSCASNYLVTSDAYSKARACWWHAQVPTLQEYLDLVKGNADRVVGIYPETKHPTWHDSLKLACTNGTSFTTLLLQVPPILIFITLLL